MARPSSASNPALTKRKRDSSNETPRTNKHHKGKGKRPADEATQNVKMDSPAVQRAKREIKIRRLTTAQINALEKAFDDADGKLSHPQKVEIARGIGLEARQVAIWFQNRRAKWRTEQVENQYDVLKRQNDLLSNENEKLKRELEDMRIALAAARSGIAHPTPSRMERGAGGTAFFGSKDGESPGSVYEKLQNLIQSMKGKRSPFLPSPAPRTQNETQQDSGESDVEESDSVDSASDSDSESDSSEEEEQPIERPKKSIAQKKEPTPPPRKPSKLPSKGGKAAALARKSPAQTGKLPGPPPKAPPGKGNLQREPSFGRASTLKRPASNKLEALKLPVKMSPVMPLFPDKDRLTPPVPKSKLDVNTPPSSTVWLGTHLDPSPTTGPLENLQGGGSVPAETSAALLDKVPPSALGRGFSHLVNGPPLEASPTESNISPSAYLLSDGKESSPTTGALAGGDLVAGKTSPRKPSPLGEDAAKLQLAPSTSEWGEALLMAAQQHVAGPASQPLPEQGLSGEETARDFSRGFGGGDCGRSPSPAVREFPNSAAQDFLAKYRAMYGDIHRSADEGGGATDSLLAFVNGTEVEEEGAQQEALFHRERASDPAGYAHRLAALMGSGKALDTLAMLNLMGGERDTGATVALQDFTAELEKRNSLLELSLSQAAGQARGLERPPGGHTWGPSFMSTFSASPSAFEAFRGGGGNLLDPYQDPPLPERALSPSLRHAISQHQSGQSSGLEFLERRDGGRGLSVGGPLTPRLGGQIQQGMPPWLTAVANGPWGNSDSPA